MKRACCVYHERRNRIVCFYQGDIDRGELSRALGELLPEYMVPNEFRQMEELPITKNGKIDRQLLTQMAGERIKKQK